MANYYQSQEMRKRSDMQFRHLGDKIEVMSERASKLLRYTNEVYAQTEAQVANALKEILSDKDAWFYSVAKWLQAQRGIGPIITAGLVAHIDITRAPTAGHIWSFAGLNPEMKWREKTEAPIQC